METKDKISQLKELLSLKHEISDFLYAHKDEFTNLKSSKQVEIQDILDLSRRISLTTRAPPLWKPGQPLPITFGHPPCLQLEELANGKLRQQQLELINQKQYLNQNTDIITNNDNVSMDIDIVRTESKSNITVSNVNKIFDHLGIKPLHKPIESKLTQQIESVVVTHMDIEEEQPTKKPKLINLSFGLSDSEDSDED